MTRPERSVLRTPRRDLPGCAVPTLLGGMGGATRWALAVAVAAVQGSPVLRQVRRSPELIETEVRALRDDNDWPPAVSLGTAAEGLHRMASGTS